MNRINNVKIDFESKSFSRNRRFKSFLFLLTCLGFSIYPHFIDEKVFSKFVIFISLIVAAYGLLVIIRNNNNLNYDFENSKRLQKEQLPYLDILVAARDEQNVISSLVDRLFQLNYPQFLLGF